MGLFSKKSASSENLTEQASAESSIVYGRNVDRFTVTPLQAYQFYKYSAPLADSVDKITDAIISMRIGMLKAGKFDSNDEFVKLLKKSGDGGNLLGELTTSHLLSREMWVIARGRVSGKPLELTYEYGYNLTYSGEEGKLPETIRTNSARDRRVYNKKILNGIPRYIDNTGLNELFPIIGKKDIGTWRGMSKINSILDEIRQNEEGKKHNLSLLKNGMKPSAFITPKNGNLSKQVIKGLTDALRFFNSGSRNAGKTLTLSTPVDIQDNMVNNADMDYLNLLNKNDSIVYNRYNIPQPLVNADNMTLGNYSTAQIAFYDNAVLPTFREIAGALIASLAVRFDFEDVELIADTNEIPALKSRSIEQMKGLQGTSSIAINEIRAVGAYQPVVGGDQVFMPANLLPIGATMPEGE